MKLSTRLNREVGADLLHGRKIKLCVGGGTSSNGRVDVYTFENMELADAQHNKLIKSGCKLLLKECPVINSNNEVVMHYTRTTYRDWREG